MPEKDRDQDADLDDLDTAARIRFRDYPSSAVVVLAALGSGLAWLAYRWRGRKGGAKDAPDERRQEPSRSGSSPDRR